MDASEIRLKRKKIGISQKFLAEKAGVSQSLIARIEKGGVDPRLSTFRKITKTLDELSSRMGKRAGDVMVSPVVFVRPDEKLAELVKIMSNRGISQVPVIEGGIQKGSVSEADVLGVKCVDMPKTRVRDIMNDPFPEVAGTTRIEDIVELVKNQRAVLVRDRESIVGIITKIDVIDALI